MRILLAGETWTTFEHHQKGFNAYTAGSYEEGGHEFVDALTQRGATVERIATHEATTMFPRTAGALADYDCIVLSDIGADTLQLHPDTLKGGSRTPDPLALLADYVRLGGGLLMIGGYMSFSGFEGRARYGLTPLAQVLPVELLGHDDRVECPDGVTPTVSSPHPILHGMTGEWPWFLGYNKVVPADGATTVLRFGDDPLLVVSAFEDGRVAAFTSDLAPHWGSPAFLAWDEYGRFWFQLITWLAKS